MKLRICILAILSLGMSVYLLYHFIFIWQYGEYHVNQPGSIMLYAALVVIVFSLIYSFYCIIKQINNINSVRPMRK